MAFTIAVIPAAPAQVPPYLSVTSYQYNSTLQETAFQFSFVHLTDLHIGEGVDDYGTPGYDDTPPPGDEGTPAVNLRNAVNWINSNAGARRIQFVVVTGDFTDSGEKSEMMKAKEILDSLFVPYVPLLGNHDVWPYTQSAESYFPVGDQYFSEVFEPQFERLRSTLPGWDEGTRLTPIWNGEADSLDHADEGCYSYFQNFAFDYAGYHFMCTDFNTRNHALSGRGANPDPDLFDSPQCQGTWPWFEAHFQACATKASENVAVFMHQPLTVIPIFSFSQEEYDTVASFLAGANRNFSGLVAAGHVHRNATYDVSFGGDVACPAFETAANKDGGGNLRLVNVWGKTWKPEAEGVILYTDANFGGMGELFPYEDADLSNNYLGGDTASSARILGGGEAMLFDGSFFSGGSLKLTSDVADLAGGGFDNRTSSVKFQSVEDLNTPVVTGVSPDTGTRGTVVKVSVTGEKFKKGASVCLSRAGEEAIRGTSVDIVSTRKINCKFDLTRAEPGDWDLSVTNPGGYTGTLAGCFYIRKPSKKELPRLWYLAEGSTGGDFETWVLVANPGENQARVALTYLTPEGPIEGPPLTLEPGTRASVNVAATVPDTWDVSTKVESDEPVVAERAMYWGGRLEGHDSIGYP